MARKKKAIERTTPSDRKGAKSTSTVIIRWELLEPFIKKGYNGKEIAEKFGISFTTLQRRCKKEQGWLVGDYIRNSPERIIKEFEQPERQGSTSTTWDSIDRMLEAGCLGTEIAATYDMSEEYFCKLMKIKNKENFSDTRRAKKNKGDAQLRIRQYGLAMKGDKQMLTILGKDRLSQVEKQEINMNVKARVLSKNEINEYLKGLDQDY